MRQSYMNSFRASTQEDEHTDK